MTETGERTKAEMVEEHMLRAASALVDRVAQGSDPSAAMDSLLKVRAVVLEGDATRLTQLELKVAELGNELNTLRNRFNLEKGAGKKR